MLASPVFMLGSTVASILAAAFHLLYGRKLTDLVLYWFVALLGFFVGQGLADVSGLRFLMLGQLHIVEGTLGCVGAMAVVRWLRTG